MYAVQYLVVVLSQNVFVRLPTSWRCIMPKDGGGNIVRQHYITSHIPYLHRRRCVQSNLHSPTH